MFSGIPHMHCILKVMHTVCLIVKQLCGQFPKTYCHYADYGWTSS